MQRNVVKLRLRMYHFKSGEIVWLFDCFYSVVVLKTGSVDLRKQKAVTETSA